MHPPRREPPPLIRTCLVGRGQDLAYLLATLADRARPLGLDIRAVVDLDADDRSDILDHARRIGVPLITGDLADLSRLEDPNLVILSVSDPEVQAALTPILPAGTAVLGPDFNPLWSGVSRLAGDNRALRLDSRRLKETRLRLNLFVETAPLAIYIKDRELRYRRMNSHALHVLGFRQDDIVGRTDHTLYPGGGARWLQKVEQETLRTGKTLHATGVLPLEGKEMHVQVTLFPIIEDDRTEGLYGLVEDTTELFQSEQKLHEVDEQLNETQKYLREVLENSKDMIFLTDPQGKLLSFNNGAENVLGFQRDEVVGTPAHRLCANPGTFDNLFNKALREGHASKYEAEFVTQDHRQVICNISLTLIDGPDGKPLEVVCLCRDITTRLRLKDDLIRSERLAAVGQLASGVAHEINNPMAVIDTIAGLVEETLVEEGDKLDPETRKILAKGMERLHAQVGRVTRITHSMLGFVRTAQTGMAVVNLEDLLRECLELLGTEIRRSGTELNTHFAADTPEFTSDPMLLQQVFVNLLKNAVDAMSEMPGRPSLLEVTTSYDATCVQVMIQDNGTGVPKEEHDKIFNLFHTTKPAGKGTGLGLSIVHDILHRLGGKIRVASEASLWTRFTVEIPLNPPETPLPDPSISP